VWSSPYINHFLQPDSIISDPSNLQAFNRFSYTLNNPVNRIDPSGHDDYWCNSNLCRSDVRNRRLLSMKPKEIRGKDIMPYIKAVAEHYGIELAPDFNWDLNSESCVHLNADPNEACTPVYGVTQNTRGGLAISQQLSSFSAYISASAFDELGPIEFATVLVHEARHTWQYHFINHPELDQNGLGGILASDPLFSQSNHLEADAYYTEAKFLEQFGVTSTTHLGNSMEISNAYRKVLGVNTLVVPLPMCQPLWC
jgi:hypothetical protein